MSASIRDGGASRSDTLLTLVGPTACGKTKVALELARQFDLLELVSIDSMTVYRSMDIGTAKPRRNELEGIEYHLLDVVDPWEEYSVSQFQIDARKTLDLITERNGIPLLVGGTGLYYQAVVDGLEIPGRWPDIREGLESIASTENGLERLYRQLVELDPAAAVKMRPNNSRRIVRALEVTLGSGTPFSQHGPGLFSNVSGGVRAVGIDPPRASLYEQIEHRLDLLLASGWVEEVRRLIDGPNGASRTARQALGYKEIIGYIEGKSTMAETRSAILARTRRFARRQLAWFKRDPRIVWFDSSERAKLELVSIVSGVAGDPLSDLRGSG
ncbi:MAG: tRNA (adenosine(37)-N6)-dimethylallyltransferase MiaA [Actinomycetota bacterium]|nr:tRNA (adenosine(37)-N6)-dimethylallyltransferase MiaA [Actinomycetota bacterium]